MNKGGSIIDLNFILDIYTDKGRPTNLINVEGTPALRKNEYEYEKTYLEGLKARKLAVLPIVLIQGSPNRIFMIEYFINIIGAIRLQTIMSLSGINCVIPSIYIGERFYYE